jgi:excisionase family DNA binding protein
MDLTTTQIAALVGKSERTVQRWIDAGTIQAERISAGRYRIDESEIQRLAHDPHADQIAELRAEVRELRARLTELEAIVTSLTVTKARPAPTIRSGPLSAAAPGGAISARRFAEIHNITRETMQGWINRGEIATTPAAYGGRTQHQLNQEQQAQVIDFWNRLAVPYQPCPQCPHRPSDDQPG